MSSPPLSGPHAQNLRDSHPKWALNSPPRAPRTGLNLLYANPICCWHILCPIGTLMLGSLAE